MPEKLETVVVKIDKIPNSTNAALVKEFHAFMKSNGASERHQKNSLKALIAFANHLGPSLSFPEIKRKEQILAFLDSKEKSITDDPEKKWITTWNSYLTRIKHFIRWLHSQRGKRKDIEISEWKTPAFARIKEKRTKRLSPYSETEVWDRDEFLFVLKYEPSLKAKAALALCWDLDARPHEVCLLKIKNIRLRDRFGEGEVPYQSKTGSGPILLTASFPYVRDLLNIHPSKDSPDAPLIWSLQTGDHLKPDSIWHMMQSLRNRIQEMLNDKTISDEKEREKLEYLLKTKRWNPYCWRHSALSWDADILPEFALRKKARWTLDSRQPARYLKNRWTPEMKRKILVEAGVIPEEIQKPKPVTLECPRCIHINPQENKYCSKCSYPLSQSALEEIKTEEDKKVEGLQAQIERQQNQIDYLIRYAQGKTKDSDRKREELEM